MWSLRARPGFVPRLPHALESSRGEPERTRSEAEAEAPAKQGERAGAPANRAGTASVE